MKLLRVGELGKESVAALDSNNKIRDLSDYIDDLNPKTLNEKTLNKLKKICLENLSEYKQPDYWSFLTKDLPKNKNGKVLKSLLIEEMKDKF